MPALGGPTVSDDPLKALYDLDETKHRYHIIRTMTPAQAVEYRKKIRKRNANRLFVPDAQKIVFRTVGRGRGRRVIAMRRKIHWRAAHGHYEKNGQEPRWFGSHSFDNEGPGKGY